jgi:hypothetical protein
MMMTTTAEATALVPDEAWAHIGAGAAETTTKTTAEGTAPVPDEAWAHIGAGAVGAMMTTTAEGTALVPDEAWAHIGAGAAATIMGARAGEGPRKEWMDAADGATAISTGGTPIAEAAIGAVSPTRNGSKRKKVSERRFVVFG